MKVLLTNDDGIEAEGLQALRHALLGIDGIELAVIAPDGNRSAVGRGITTRRPLPRIHAGTRPEQPDLPPLRGPGAPSRAVALSP